MKLSEHRRIIEEINITEPFKERVEKYEKKLKEYGCDFNRIIYTDLGMDIEIEYNGKEKRNIWEYITSL